MKNLNQKQSLIGGIVAILLGTSCCWLPFLIIGLGGASGWVAFSAGLEKFSLVFMLLGVSLLAYGGNLFYKKKNSKLMNQPVVLASEITCPKCDFQTTETMPTDACQYFYECKKCQEILKPKQGDCCVFCSYGTVACPPIQLDQNCC